jgi:hypothetical protein
MNLQPVTTNFAQYNANTEFNVPFNQAIFQNFDTVNSVFINGIEVKKLTALDISLNVSEYNTSLFSIDFRGSSTAALTVIYTLYNNIGKYVNTGI